MFVVNPVVLVQVDHPKFILIPSNLMLSHPKIGDLYVSFEQFLISTILIVLSASHLEGSADDGHHLKGKFGGLNVLPVLFELFFGGPRLKAQFFIKFLGIHPRSVDTAIHRNDSPVLLREGLKGE